MYLDCSKERSCPILALSVLQQKLEKLQAKLNEAVGEATSILDDADPNRKSAVSDAHGKGPRRTACRGKSTRRNVVTAKSARRADAELADRASHRYQGPGKWQTLEAKFDTHDLGWARTLWHMIKDARKKFAWQKAQQARSR